MSDSVGMRVLRLCNRIYRFGVDAAGVVLSVVAVGPAVAHASPPAAVRLQVGLGNDGVSGCPSASELAAAANRALGRDGVKAVGPETGGQDDLLIDVTFSRESDGYSATVRAPGPRDGERVLRTREASCAALASVVGVAVSMIVDAAETSANSQPAPVATAPVAEARATPPEPVSPQPAPTPPSDRRTAFDGVYIEGLGNGVYDSINYERTFFDGPFAVGVRVGFGYAPLSICGGAGQSPCSLLGSSYHRVDEYSLPVLANGYWGSASHKLEVGVGIVGIYRTGNVSGGGFLSGSVDGSFSIGSKGVDLAATASVGYRFVPVHGGPSFGGGFTPVVGARGILPWFSLNAGAQFW